MNVQTATNRLNQVQEQINTSGYRDSLFDQEKVAQMDLEKTLKDQEMFWQEKSRVNWLTHGDRNTQFFHKMARIRNVTKQINLLKHVDIVLSNSEDIEGTW